MSTTTAETLRASSTDELNDKLREAKEELFNLRFQAATGQQKTMAALLQFARRSREFTQFYVNVNQGLESAHE